MKEDSFSNLVTWQKVAIIFIVIFGLIIAFSYFQSTRVEQRDVVSESFVPPLEEETVNLEMFASAPEISPSVVEKSPIAKTLVTAPVKPQPALTGEVAVTIPQAVEPAKPKGSYGIQVASFKESNKAKKLQQTLKDQGYEAEVAEKNLAEKGIWYQVMVEQYASKADAEAKLTEIKVKYPNSFIKKR